MYQIEDYNKLSFVVRTNKLYAPELKQLGGRWNPNLIGGPGWIFNKRRHGKIIIDFVDEYNENLTQIKCKMIIFYSILLGSISAIWLIL